MSYFRLIKILITVSILLLGCSSCGTGSEGGGGGGGEEPEQYNLSVSPDPSEGGSVNPSNETYDEGTRVTVEATANEGWTFTEWSGGQSSTENPLSFTINSDTDLSANFEETTTSYSFMASASPAEAGSVSPQDTTVEEGALLSVEATAQSGWQFTEWSGDVSSTENPLPLIITEDTEITANFEEVVSKFNFSATASPDDGGSVDHENGIFDEGTEVTVEATASEGWTFTKWTGDINSTENPLSFNINSDTDLAANFEQIKSEYSFSLTVKDSEDSIELTFGQAEGATDGFDNGIDTEAPPPPPKGALNAFFEGQDRKLLDDFRATIANNLTWTLQYQVGSGESLTLSWTLDETALNGSVILTDDSGSFGVDMLNETEFSFHQSEYDELLIKYKVNN